MNLLEIKNFEFIPANQEVEKDLEETIIYAKIYLPHSGWTWYVSEFHPSTESFFGFVNGLEQEWKYFGLYELNSVIEDGWEIIIDKDFKPIKFSDLKPSIKPLLQYDPNGNILDR